MPAPGEPLFTEEDTAYAIALAEEERDACPACGMPKAWCRDNKEGRFKYEVLEDFCWTTYHLENRRNALADNKKKSPSDKRAMQLFARFRDGYEPDYGADLGLVEPEADSE